MQRAEERLEIPDQHKVFEACEKDFSQEEEEKVPEIGESHLFVADAENFSESQEMWPEVEILLSYAGNSHSGAESDESEKK